MKLLVASITVGLAALACGQDSLTVQTPTPTVGPALQPTAIEYPEVTVAGDQFSISLPCSYLFHTFYGGEDTDMHSALRLLRQDLETYVPKQFSEPEGTPLSGPSVSEVMFTDQDLTEELMRCHWKDEKREELEKEAEELKRETDERLETIRQQLRNYTPTP